MAGAFMLLNSLGCYAEHLSAEEALARATTKGMKQVRGISTVERTPVFTGANGGYYIFDSSAGDGFMVLPADDAYPAVVAWGDRGGFSYENAAPAMLDMLAAFDAQVAAGAVLEKSPRQAGPDIEALVRTKWDQGAPYNNLTPEINGEHTLTGCVATAMAQVFKTMDYPHSGHGSVSYGWSTGGGTLSYDFDGKEFDYSKMSDVYDGQSAESGCQAVAELMLACGMAVEMDYSPVFSGATDMSAAIGLTEYFGFSKSLDLQYRDFYRIDRWSEMIYDELSQGRPVLYYGFSPLGGHAFVCDGYRYDNGNAYFHFNWGWSGVSDGYFLANLLNPEYIGNGAEATGFNMEQSAIFGLVPAVGMEADPVEKMLCFGMFVPGKLDYSRSSNLLFGVSSGIIRAGMFNMSIVPLSFTPGLKLTGTESGDTLFVAATQEYKVNQGESIASFTVRGKEMPDSGKYLVTPAYRIGDGEWIDMPQTLFLRSRMTVSCSGEGFIIDVADDSYAVTVEDVEIDRDIIVNGEPVEIGVTCRSHVLDDEPTVLVPVLINSYGLLAAQLDGKSIVLEDGETGRLTWNGTFPDVEPGSYQFGIINEKFMLVSIPVPVIVIDKGVSAELEITDVRINRKLASSGSVMTVGGQDISFTFKAICTKGYFDGSLSVAVIDADGGIVKFLADASEVVIAPGQSVSLSVKGNVDGLDPERTYSLAVHSAEASSPFVSELYPFRAPMASLDCIEADSGEAVYYNLQGFRVDNPVRGNVYIRVCSGTVSKIVSD